MAINFSNIGNTAGAAVTANLQERAASLMGFAIPPANGAGVSLAGRPTTSADSRALRDKWGDPLSLNFKFMVDFDKPYGLFAPETNVNSALAYLKRIGDEVRYSMLKTWIEQFQLFIKERDFMFQTLDGVDIIMNKKLGDMYNEATDRITFMPVRSHLQSLFEEN